MTITRFAPSPTGGLHIGGARTALFNLLHAKHNNGTFLLRIEDTDKKRSSDQYLSSIIDGLKWLGINWDGDIVFQSQREQRHKEIAYHLLDQGLAYKCYMTAEEINQFKIKHQKILSPWRNQDIPPKKDSPFVIRLKIPQNQNDFTHLDDIVQGKISVSVDEIDDMVLLRSDDTPTYMLASVVDDHDMGVDTIIRGDDHLTNTFRHLAIYSAMQWERPKFAHIPLIHNADGTKLSKRFGAPTLFDYRNDGYLPEALQNYILRLGWGGDGNTEIFSFQEAVNAFDISDVSKSPARLDVKKLEHLNRHYIRHSSSANLLTEIRSLLTQSDQSITQQEAFFAKITLGLESLRSRANTLRDIITQSAVYNQPCNPPDSQSFALLTDKSNHALIRACLLSLSSHDNWSTHGLKDWSQKYCSDHDIKSSLLMQNLRAFVLGSFNSPSVYEVMSVIGKEAALERINSSIHTYASK